MHGCEDIECVVLLISCSVCRLIHLCIISCGSFMCCVGGLFCTFICSGWVSLLCVIGDSVMAGKSVVGVMFVRGELGWLWKPRICWCAGVCCCGGGDSVSWSVCSLQESMVIRDRLSPQCLVGR